VYVSDIMDVAECSRCGQPIVNYPFEDGWNHYPWEKVDWVLTETSGCFAKAEPAKEKVWSRKR
jgi:hypothetical protein